MGKPIKDRGIRWVEQYGDKSAWLKEQFYTEIGPGSYFRWEGHDSTTGTDYYVVVSPGHSEKKGYHFFAGLRKMPADHGASGKKFHTQAEAMSYAYEKWRVPTPSEKPAKAYTTKDIVGSPTVLHPEEDKKASMSPKTTIISANARTVPMERQAMALQHTGKYGYWKQKLGPYVLLSFYDWAARAGLAMGYGAALYTRKEFVGVDRYNMTDRKKGLNTLTGQDNADLPISPKMATCESPSDEEIQEVLNNGVTHLNKLFSTKEDGSVIIRSPAFQTQREDYRHVTFNSISNIETSLSVGWQAHEELLRRLEGVRSRITWHLDKRPTGATGNFKYSLVIPIDLYNEIATPLHDIATLSISDFAQRNAVTVYEAAKNGKCRRKPGKNQPEVPVTTADLQAGAPLFEQVRLHGANVMTYDKRGIPLGIKTSRGHMSVPKPVHGTGLEEELKAGERPEATYYVLKSQVLNGWLARPDVRGDPKALRELLATNKIPLTGDMFVDSRTAAPKMAKIHMQIPDVDDFLRPSSVQFGTKVENIVPPYDLEPRQTPGEGGASSRAVRVYDRATGRDKLVLAPETAQRQEFEGARMLDEDASNYVRGEDGSWHPINAGEWRYFDPDSTGKFIPGDFYRVILAPHMASIKGSDKKRIHKKGEEREGFYLGYSTFFAKRGYKKGEPAPNDPNVEEVVRDESGRVVGYYSITTRQHPESPFTSATVTESKPLQIPRYQVTENGLMAVRDQNGEPAYMTITHEQAFIDPVSNKLLFKNSQVAMDYLKNVLGLNDDDVGPWTPTTSEDLRMIDELTRESLAKAQQVKEGTLSPEQLTEQDRIFHETLESRRRMNPRPTSNTGVILSSIPESFLNKIRNIGQNPEEDFSAREGRLWGVRRAGTQDDWLVSEFFATQGRAEAMKAAVVANGDKFGVTSEVEVEVAPSFESAPLMPSAREADTQNVTHNTEVMTGLGEFARGIEEQPGPIGPDETPQETAEEKMEPEPVHAPVAEPQVAPTIEEPQAIPGAAPVEPAPPTSAPVPRPPPKPQAPARPSYRYVAEEDEGEAEDVPVSIANNNAIGRLVALANKLDEMGRAKEADAVDRIIQASIRGRNAR
jgi:hypothetical protein